MAIMRKQKVNRYTVVDNYAINDKSLDAAGKGYLLYMLSKPDNWRFSFKNLEDGLNASERNVRKNIHKLESLHYLKRERIKDKNNKYEWNYYLYEIPYDIDFKIDNFEYGQNEHVQVEDVQSDNVYINTNNNKDKDDKGKSSFFNAEDHHRLTLELINKKYINENDLQLYYYDKLFEEVISEGMDYEHLINSIGYITDRVLERNFEDEEGYEIKNKYGYFKKSLYDYIYKLNNPIDNLYEEVEDYDWRNDNTEEDYEL